MVKGLVANDVKVSYAEITAASGHDAFLMSDGHYHAIIKSYFKNMSISK